MVGSAPESRAVLFCLVASLIGISALALFFRSGEAAESFSLSSEDAGRIAFFKGRVVSLRSYESGFFLKVCGADCASVFVPAAVAEEMRAHSLEPESLSGRVVEAKGLVSEDSYGIRVTVFEPDGIEVTG